MEKLVFIIQIMPDLSVISYNCRGAMSSYSYIDSLLSQTDILCIQEHHLVPETVGFLGTINPNFTAKVHICDSNYNESGYRVYKGGVAILWRKSIDYMISEIHSDLYDDRIMGICVKSLGMKPIYIFNVYLPSTNTPMSEYISVTNTLQVLYDTYVDKGFVVIMGDLNAQLGPEWGPRAGINQSDRGKVLHDFLKYTPNDMCVDLLSTLH